ncbi:MAG TPA: hypothetical protein VHR38_15455 [Solirubrobacterales bacterium]|jgi:hypothetical protein|nr:hypothetical protein [Solirubrobacterales bacterium]
MEDRDRRLTRRQTLGIAGAAGSAVVLGGSAGKLPSQMGEGSGRSRCGHGREGVQADA